MSEYTLPPPLPPELKGMIDPDGGFLCLSVHWRPDLEVSDPDRPGQKLSMSSYIPVLPQDDCLCGSGKPYHKCCRRKRVWHPICPDPGGQRYSLVRPQTATFHGVDGPAIRKRLMADVRLHCVDESLESSFWILWGDPPVEDQYGILCFGDLELKENHTLVVTAMSDLRARVLLDLLQEVAGDLLDPPHVSQDPTPVIEKPTRKARMRTPRRKRRRKRRRR